MDSTLLLAIFLLLVAMVAMVPLSKAAGLGTVLGYLAAGVLIGPYGLRLVSDSDTIRHVAEFGVVMMLFLVGLELRPALLWQLRRPILGLGGCQVIGSIAALTGAAILLGVELRPALAIGMILTMSSTAIVLSSLTERALIKTEINQWTDVARKANIRVE